MRSPLGYLKNKAFGALLGGTSAYAINRVSRVKNLNELDRLSRRLGKTTIIDKYFHPEEVAVLNERIRQASGKLMSKDKGIKDGVLLGMKFNDIANSSRSANRMAGGIGGLLMNAYDTYAPIRNSNTLNRLRLIRARESVSPFYRAFAPKNKDLINSLNMQIAKLTPKVKKRGLVSRYIRGLGTDVLSEGGYMLGNKVYRGIKG